MDYSFVTLNSLLCFQCLKGFLIYLFKGILKGRICAILRHMEGQELYESDPSQGKLQKDLDYVHIPMYTTIGVISTYVHGYRGKSHLYHFSCVFRDDQGHIKRQKVVHMG